MIGIIFSARYPDLRRLVLARMISVTGDMMVPIALAFAVLRATGSASALGLVLASRAVPSIIFMLFGGAVGDIFPRRRVMFWSQFIAAVSQIMLGVVFLLPNPSLFLICIFCALRGVTSSFFNPSSTAAISYSSDANSRQVAFSLFSMIGSVAEVLGPVIAGALIAFLSPGWLLVIDGTTFLISAMLIARCRSLGGGYTQRERKSVFGDIRDGMKVVFNTPWLLGIVISSAIFQFSILPAMSVLGPSVADQSLGGAGAWGIVMGSMGLGGVVGGFISMRLKFNGNVIIVYLFGIIASGPTLLCLAFGLPLYFVVLTEFISGLSATVAGVIENTIVAENIASSILSRVDSVNRLGSTGLKPLGMAIIAPIGDFAGVDATLIVAALIGMSAMLVPLLLPKVRKVF
jgi:Bacterial protein of unknown function (DUF894).